MLGQSFIAAVMFSVAHAWNSGNFYGDNQKAFHVDPFNGHKQDFGFDDWQVFGGGYSGTNLNRLAKNGGNSRKQDDYYVGDFDNDFGNFAHGNAYDQPSWDPWQGQSNDSAAYASPAWGGDDRGKGAADDSYGRGGYANDYDNGRDSYNQYDNGQDDGYYGDSNDYYGSYGNDDGYYGDSTAYNGYEQQDYGYEQQDYGYEQQDYGYDQNDYGYEQQDYGFDQQDFGYEQQSYGHDQ